MSATPIAAVRLPALAAGAPEVALTQGAIVVARVAHAPAAGGGPGLISLAGVLVEARLPEGIRAGDRLRLRVDAGEPGRLVLRTVRASAPEGPDEAPATARLAGLLALSGDGELLRAAVELAGGPDAPIALPGHAAAEIRVDPDAGAPGGDADGRAAAAGEAGFVLHTPALGTLEVRLVLAAGTVRATVTAAAGAPAAAAEAGAPGLVARLERATGCPAAAAVTERGPGERAPRPPAVLGGFDALA